MDRSTSAKAFLATVMALGLLLGCSPHPEPPDPPLDPTSIERTGRPNDHLVCAMGMCKAEAAADAPLLDIDPGALFDRWLSAIEALPRIRMVHADPGSGLIHAEQRSRVFRFVDTILVKVIPAEGGATFAAYSRSNLGYGDMGVNKERLDALIGVVTGEK